MGKASKTPKPKKAGDTQHLGDTQLLLKHMSRRESGRRELQQIQTHAKIRARLMFVACVVLGAAAIYYPSSDETRDWLRARLSVLVFCASFALVTSMCGL